MKLVILVDNVAVVGKGEWGFSCFIEADEKCILLDTGASGLFLQNAQLMGIDLSELDYVVLSHGHWDHTWGLEDLMKLYFKNPGKPRPAIMAHPGVFDRRVSGKGGEVGTLVDAHTLAGRFPLQLGAEPAWITERLLWLGQIEQRYAFEKTEKPGFLLTPSGRESDPIVDDSALAYRTDEGLVIITGCSHSGICNIIEQARQFTGEERVIDVVGGTHLIDPPEERMQATIDYFRRLQPRELHVGHCTSLEAKVALAGHLKVKEMHVGLQLEY